MRRATITSLGFLLLGGLLATPAMAGFPVGVQVTGYSTSVDLGGGTATFVIEFDGPPAFFSTDDSPPPTERQTDSFQFLVFERGAGWWQGDAVTLVRGGEIHFAGDVRVRCALPPNPCPDPLVPQPDGHSGGWGLVRGSVPYQADGNTIEFTMPLDLLLVGTEFDYEFMGLNYGRSYLIEQGRSGEAYGTLADADGDGVANHDDLCEGTAADSIAEENLKKRHYAWYGGETFTSRGNKDPVFSIADTGGCSADQIIDQLGLGAGHSKFGLSIGALRRWVDLVNAP